MELTPIKIVMIMGKSGCMFLQELARKGRIRTVLPEEPVFSEVHILTQIHWENKHVKCNEACFLPTALLYCSFQGFTFLYLQR